MDASGAGSGEERKWPAGAPAPDERPGLQAALRSGALSLQRPARRRLLAVLESASDGLTVGALASLLGVRHNAVRKQLTALQHEGVVTAEPLPPVGRGRPSLLWRRVAVPGDPVAEGHRKLVALLLGLVRHAGFSDADVEAFGREQGRLLGAPGGREALAEAFARLGFAPEETAGAAARRAGRSDLRLNACPFRDAVLQPGGEAVCSLHRGLAAGLAERAAPGGELVALDVVDPVRGGCRVRARGLGAPAA